MRVLLAVVTALILLSSWVLPAEVSYRNLTKKQKATAFYSCGGRSHANRRVHIHVPASRLLARPTRTVRTRSGRKLYRFANKSVPILVRPRNIYYRKMLQRVKKGDMVCVKGVVKNEPLAGKGRYALFVTTLKKAP